MCASECKRGREASDIALGHEESTVPAEVGNKLLLVVKAVSLAKVHKLLEVCLFV